jgi:antirestriction protein ArdC
MANTVYAIITDRIIGLLEAGVCPWRQPWKSIPPQNAASGHEYRGVNAFLLGSLPFPTAQFLSFKQAKELGGSVRKGEHGFPCVYWKMLDREDDDGKRRTFPLLRYYTVFNIAQCEGLEGIPAPAVRESVPAERIVSSYVTGPMVQHAGDRAFYSPGPDRVTMPPRETFESEPAYWTVLYHELVHSTGHKSRLARFDAPDQFQFSSESYSREELVAEMGAAFVAAEAGISSDLGNSAAYLAGWLRALKAPKGERLMVEAAGKASRAADLIMGRQREEGGADA